jgi:hypothetical protein
MTSTTWTPQTMGRKGGIVKSAAKARAARANGKKGGAPKRIIAVSCRIDAPSVKQRRKSCEKI